MIGLEPTPEWWNLLETILIHGSRIYFWLLFGFGLILCIWTFKKTKEKGFLLIAIFFLSPLFGIVMREVSYQIHKDELIERKRARAEQTDSLPSIETNITLPIFETALVVGLFIVCRTRIKKNQPPTLSDATRPTG